MLQSGHDVRYRESINSITRRTSTSARLQQSSPSAKQLAADIVTASRHVSKVPKNGPDGPMSNR
jgi:hypothetical protein